MMMYSFPRMVAKSTFCRMYSIGIVGAGRIGLVHAESISRAGAQIIAIADPNAHSAKRASETFDIPSWTTNEDDIFQDAAIQAVLICSPTAQHAQQMIKAANRKKHIFCEKPIDLDLQIVNDVARSVERAGVQCMIGFNRRFDANARRVRQAIETKEIGELNLIRITSYDPSPPPLEYLKQSGGLFCDMAIHDFDMARYLAGDEVKQVYAVGQCRDPKIATVGDIDTAMCLLTFQNGVLANIENSRVAAYGYDQRLEVLGSKGGASSANVYPNQVTLATNQSVYRDLPMNFFLERYMDSYVEEMRVFLNACQNNTEVQVGIHDGREALRIAKAADLSLREQRPVLLAEIIHA